MVRSDTSSRFASDWAVTLPFVCSSVSSISNRSARIDVFSPVHQDVYSKHTIKSCQYLSGIPQLHLRPPDKSLIERLHLRRLPPHASRQRAIEHLEIIA